MKENVPKLKKLQLVNYITDLFLVSIDMDEEVKIPQVRNIWRLFFLSFIIFMMFALISKSFLVPYALNSINLTYYMRILAILFALYFVIIVCFIVFRHYKYLFKTGKDLTFGILIVYYIGFLLFTALLYFNFYILKPELYITNNLGWESTPLFSAISYDKLYCLLNFIIYTACSMFSINYPRIVSNSLIISLLNVLEVLIGITLLSLYISTFVQKTCK